MSYDEEYKAKMAQYWPEVDLKEGSSPVYLSKPEKGEVHHYGQKHSHFEYGLCARYKLMIKPNTWRFRLYILVGPRIVYYKQVTKSISNPDHYIKNMFQAASIKITSKTPPGVASGHKFEKTYDLVVD